MDLDDLEPRRKPQPVKDLSGWSIGDLEAHIAELEGEILRARAVIKAKQAQKSAADLLFKKT